MNRSSSIFQLDPGRGFARLMSSARARRFICSPPHTPQGLGRGYFLNLANPRPMPTEPSIKRAIAFVDGLADALRYAGKQVKETMHNGRWRRHRLPAATERRAGR